LAKNRSGQADRESKDFALRLGADRFFAKPFDLDLVRRALQSPNA